MSRIYDNWERLVAAVLRREELWELCHAPSISTQPSDSDFSFPSPFSDLSIHFSASSSIPGSGSSSPSPSYMSNHPRLDFANSRVLKPEHIYVNNKLLDSRELFILQSCPNPPRKLRLGSYWYDKHTGFWGKQGYKPYQIISVNLEVGGCLDPYASYGNTSVYINGREITQVELRLMKMIGVNCRRIKRFLIYQGGLYSEDGRMIILNIWNKPGMKLLCSLLSLPFPSSKSSDASSGDQLFMLSDHEIVSFGTGSVGTTTTFKQFMKLNSNIPVEGYYCRGKEIIRNASS